MLCPHCHNENATCNTAAGPVVPVRGRVAARPHGPLSQGLRMLALILSIFALAAQGTLQTARGRDHARLGRSFSLLSLVLACGLVLAV
jgi:hypothetical protein